MVQYFIDERHQSPEKVNDFAEGHTGSQNDWDFWIFFTTKFNFPYAAYCLRGNVTNLPCNILVRSSSNPNNNKITVVEIILVKTNIFYSGEIFHKLFSYYGKFNQEQFQDFFLGVKKITQH